MNFKDVMFHNKIMYANELKEIFHSDPDSEDVTELNGGDMDRLTQSWVTFMINGGYDKMEQDIGATDNYVRFITNSPLRIVLDLPHQNDNGSPYMAFPDVIAISFYSLDVDEGKICTINIELITEERKKHKVTIRYMEEYKNEYQLREIND